MGSDEGTAAFYNWRFYYSLPGLAVWFVLILAFIIPKSNRDRRVLLILIPLAIVYFLWFLLKWATYMPSSESYQFGAVFNSIAVGLTVLWLISYKLQDFNGFIRFFLAFGLMIFISFLGIITYFPQFSEQTYIFLMFCVFVSVAMLLSVSIATKLCKRQYRPVVFMLWLAVSMIVCFIFSIYSFIGVGMIILRSGPSNIMETIVQVLLIALFMGFIAYIFNLPYFILGFVNPFFRERFCLLLRIKAVSKGENGDNIDTNTGRDEIEEAGD